MQKQMNIDNLQDSMKASMDEQEKMKRSTITFERLLKIYNIQKPRRYILEQDCEKHNENYQTSQVETIN